MTFDELVELVQKLEYENHEKTLDLRNLCDDLDQLYHKLVALLDKE